MNSLLKCDIDDFVSHFNLGNDLKDSSFLITGASGLIGSILIHCLVALNKGIKIYAPVRNLVKARGMFDEFECSSINFIECDLVDYDYSQLPGIDYIVHCAAPTGSKFFVEHPVETFSIIVEGTKVLLDFAKGRKVKSFVYLSSLEVYGEIHDDSVAITEDKQGYIDPLSVRSSYPMAKRAVENLCVLYYSQFGVNANIARLTQTTGVGIAKDDNRVIAQFARLTAQGKDIILHTTGESARPYCYTIDCISAILYILLKGKAGQAYNVANDETYISTIGMANYLKENFNPSINVRIELKDDMGYAPATKQRLSIEKLKSLGWIARYDIYSILNQLYNYLSL